MLVVYPARNTVNFVIPGLTRNQLNQMTVVPSVLPGITLARGIVDVSYLFSFVLFACLPIYHLELKNL